MKKNTPKKCSLPHIFFLLALILSSSAAAYGEQPKSVAAPEIPAVTTGSNAGSDSAENSSATQSGEPAKMFLFGVFLVGVGFAARHHLQSKEKVSAT